MSKKSSPRNRRTRKYTFDLTSQLSQIHARSFKASYIPEPKLIFYKHFRCVDPKTGLGLYGPWSLNEQGALQQIRLGIIGTGETIDLARQWLVQCRDEIFPPPAMSKTEKIKDPILFPSFPGMSSQSPFGCDLILPDNLIETISQKEIDQVINAGNFGRRMNDGVNLVIERLGILADKESPPDVVICALPKEIEDYCHTGYDRYSKEITVKLTPRERRQKKKMEEDRKKGQLSLFEVMPDTFQEPQIDPTHHNFYRALKARAMELDLPTQIAWQRTFEGAKGTEDAATRAWNFCVGLYYKAGGIPWRVEGLSKGTCYIGISFYKETGSNVLRTSMAQAFSDQGEGIVMRGEPFEWDSRQSPHLSKEAAKDLLSRVLQQYKRHLKQNPTRVVIHKSSRYWEEELQGFKESVGEIPYYDFLTLSYRGIRFLRVGYKPPCRGTVIELDRRNLVLYTRGFVPFYQQYPGMRIPRPIEIIEHHGDSSSNHICQEILALSKLNWNTAAFACAEPITLHFSRGVGQILAEVPPDQTPKPWYRFYM